MNILFQNERNTSIEEKMKAKQRQKQNLIGYDHLCDGDSPEWPESVPREVEHLQADVLLHGLSEDADWFAKDALSSRSSDLIPAEVERVEGVVAGDRWTHLEQASLCYRVACQSQLAERSVRVQQGGDPRRYLVGEAVAIQIQHAQDVAVLCGTHHRIDPQRPEIVVF